MKLLYFFIAVLLYKLLVNMYYLWRINYLYSIFISSFNDSNKSKFNSLEYASEMKSVILKAGVQDTRLAVSQPTGYMQVATFKASVLENILNARVDFVEATNSKFRDAMGVYKHRIFECFNPIYWIESIVNLPKRTLVYLGVDGESILVKISTLSYWILGAIYAVFSSEINEIIKFYISRLFR